MTKLYDVVFSINRHESIYAMDEDDAIDRIEKKYYQDGDVVIKEVKRDYAGEKDDRDCVAYHRMVDKNDE